MHRMVTKTYLLTVILALLMLCGAVCASAESKVDTLKSEIQDTRQTVKHQKKELLKLTREERSMFGELAAIEDRISDVEKELFQQEDDLAGIMEDEKAAKADQRVLENELDEIVTRLKLMLARIWPVHSRKLENRFGSLDNWKQADRNFVWLASLYKDTKTELDKAEKRLTKSMPTLKFRKIYV